MEEDEVEEAEEAKNAGDKVLLGGIKENSPR